MTLTGRAGLVALLLTVVVLVAPAPAGALLIVDGALLLLIALDLLIAASPRRLEVRRELPAAGRSGEPLDATLVVDNLGSRPLRGRIRDAWPPSAGLEGPTARVTIPPGERRRFGQRFVPTRRGDRTPAAVTVRAYGPLGLARPPAQPDGARPLPGAAGLPVPPAAAGEAGPAAAARGHRRRTGARARHRVRQPARLRPRRRHPGDRLGEPRPGAAPAPEPGCRCANTGPSVTAD